MWVIAAVGGASAFAESLLGQLYKERGKDSYIGGPAYYMQRGLNARWLGLIFVGFIVLTYSFVFCAVQTNAIVEAGDELPEYRYFRYREYGFPHRGRPFRCRH